MRLGWAGVVLGTACTALATSGCQRASQQAARVPAAAARATIVDAFEDVAAWSAHPADGVSLVVRSDRGHERRALRLDFDFHGGGGYAVARRAVALDLPENYAFAFQLRGEAKINHLEFKLVDASGDNVWWHVERDIRFPSQWRAVLIPKRKIGFAWGPAGGGELRHVAAIEFAITAGEGGRGSVWIDGLELRPLPPVGASPPPVRATASSAATASDVARVVDGDTATAWVAHPRDARPWVVLDLEREREFGGLVLQWERGQHAVDYDIEASADSRRWQSLRSVRAGNGGRDALFLPESQARALRLRVHRRAPGAATVALREIEIQPLEWAATRAAFVASEARLATRGNFPRGLSGEQVYWTILGGAADGDEFLLSEDGALEIGWQGFTLEPFLFESGALHTWADVRATQGLAEHRLPLPWVRWTADDLELEIAAIAAVDSGPPRTVSYAVENRGEIARRGSLFVAIRPFQVNPPAQFLNVQGGTASLRSIEWEGRHAVVNGERVVRATPAPAAFGAVTADGGDIVADFLRAGTLPAAARVRDPHDAASAAFRFDWALGPGESRTFTLDIEAPARRRRPAPEVVNAEAARTAWAAALDRVEIDIPDTLVAQTLTAQIGWIYVNRAGAAIRPGTRSYRRSWIRDGALTSSALLRTGHTEAARAFLDWFAPHQYANGKIPCVVDWRGADPTPEHDSSGEFIFLVAECLRFDGDLERTRRLWPRVQAAVSYLDSLRALRRTSEFRDTAFFGLLPPSISHEGYSAKPMHSYWDDLWALRGFADAVDLARALGLDADRDRIAAIHREFADELRASVVTAMRTHTIDYVPGCADLGDFDATSTTIALSPVQAGDVLPAAAVQRTFERYWEFFDARRKGAEWDAFTPYEIRNVGAFVRLGWRGRAHELLQWFLGQQRSQAWRQWPEVVYRDARAQRFLGDLPHGWVGSDFIRSLLEMLAYEDEAAQALVLGHGIPTDWLGGRGVAVRALPTPFGRLSYAARRDGGHVEMRVEAGLQVPPGGIVVRLPPLPDLRRVTVDGQRVTPTADGGIVLRSLPTEIVWAP